MARTKEEYEAAAMLVDAIYDDGHHIFYTPYCTICYDPDTMEIVHKDEDGKHFSYNQDAFSAMLKERKALVLSGELPPEVTDAKP